uniref:Uncharacterized protein n=1 Tax=Myoviridae sp. ctfrL10 TaxID=2826678 RepID=A0A8S5MRV7_9CAUD|nr:MAG TPA: hypothetical protein [Myoviridae sp. ctfrL10]
MINKYQDFAVLKIHTTFAVLVMITPLSVVVTSNLKDS